MRDSIVYVLLIGILIILFAMVFAILGRGEYEPSAGNIAPAVFQALR